jgi:pimeloyl-ACP methyl ester carboxylesterase
MKPDMPTFKTIQAQRDYLEAYDRELATWTVPVRGRDIETAFGRTHVLECGNPKGPALVLLHWFCSNSLEWKTMVPHLVDRFHIFALDVMGDMGKSVASAPPKTEAEIAAWADACLDRLGLEKVLLCGHSNGGFQATVVAKLLPERVAGLVLLAPAATFQAFSFRFYTTCFGTALFPSDRNVVGFAAACSVAPGRWNPALTDLLARAFRTGSIRVKVFPRVFTDQELAGLAMPVLLLLGDGEFIYSTDYVAKRARDRLPDVQVEILPGCGHAIPVDAPEATARAIDAFAAGIAFPAAAP